MTSQNGLPVFLTADARGDANQSPVARPTILSPHDAVSEPE